MELFTFGQVPFDSILYSLFITEIDPQVPYPGMNNREVMDQVSKGYRMPMPGSGQVSDPVYGTMLRCWDVDPDRRPTFEFLKHFFDDFPVTSEIPYREVKSKNSH